MKPWAAVVAISVLCAALYLPYLGALELRGEEPRRILPAWNMLQSGDWLVPRIGGSVYVKKPPFLNWSIATSFLATGTRSDWAARIPSVLWIGGFGIAATLALRRRLGDWGAFSTGLFFVSTIAMMDKGRTAEIEAMYAAQTGIAFVLWAAWWSAGRSWLAYTIPWCFLGLGMLTKGPIHLGLLYLLVVPTLILSRRLKDLWSAPHLIGLALMTVIFLPWTLSILESTQQSGKTVSIWAGEASERVQLAGINWKSWLLRPFQLVGDFLPWTPLLVFGWWQTRTLPATPNAAAEETRWDQLIRGTRWGVLIGLGILLLLPQGTARYCQPLFPALCLLLADHWRRLGAEMKAPLERHWQSGNSIAAWLTVAFALAAAILLPARTGGSCVSGAVGAVIALGLALGPRRLGARGVPLPPLVHSCLIMATVAGIALSYVGPYLNTHGDLRKTGRAMTGLFSDPKRPVIFYRTSYFRSVHYLHRPYQEIDRGSGLKPGPAYLVMPAKEESSKAIKGLLKTHSAQVLARPNWEERDMVVLRVDPRPPSTAQPTAP
jgi:4-amino-4-deoxy-L-arabinose transferase-like glycosyltransferase